MIDQKHNKSRLENHIKQVRDATKEALEKVGPAVLTSVGLIAAYKAILKAETEIREAKRIMEHEYVGPFRDFID